MEEGWIVDKPPRTRFTLSHDMTRALSKSLEVARKDTSPSRQASVHEKAWWFLRWIYFDRKGEPGDANARVNFLVHHVPQNTLQGFMSPDEAWSTAKKHRNQLVVWLDDTSPGTLNFTVVSASNEHVSSEINIQKHFLHQSSLKDVARVLFKDTEGSQKWKIWKRPKT